ncbi:SRPBCC family protein, partial [Planctomycetota bacterium]|nr:SRPBCC family protein [Planctomycetota bacterium]
KWPEWEPWSAEDDTMTWSQQDEDPEVGSAMKWKGKDGEGTMTWTNIKEEGDTITADYDLVFEGMPKASGTLSLMEVNDKTTVTWTMKSTKGGFMGKGAFLALGIEDTINGQFGKGLANLKNKVEGS